MNKLKARKKALQTGEMKRTPLRPGTERILDEGNRARYEEALYNMVLRCGPTASKATLSIRKAKVPIDGKINPMNWNINITLARNAHFQADRRLERYLEKMGIRDPFLVLVKDVAKHEIGHWEYPRGSGVGCPFDNILYHESFLGPAYEELMKTGKFSERFCRQWAKRVANATMDVINNWHVFVNCMRWGNGSGQVLFWYLAGQQGGVYTPEYTLFVRLNLMLMRNKEAKRLLKQFLCTRAVDKNGKEVKVGEMIGKSVVRMKRLLTPENMLNKNKWEAITRAYARELAKYVTEKDKPKGQTSVGDKTAAPPPQKSEKGEKEGEDGETGKSRTENEEEDGGGTTRNPETKNGEDEEEADGDEDEGEGSGNGEPETDEGEEGAEEDESGDVNPFEKLSPKDVEKIMGERAAAGKGIPFYIETNTALDAYYKSISRRLIIRGAKGELPSANYPVVPVRRRPFDMERDDVSAADMGKLFYDPVRKRMVPSVVTHHHSIDMPIRKSMKDFPRIIYLFADASGSMMTGEGNTSIVPWGDKSGYHYVLLTWYGLLAQLEYMQLLHKVEVCAGTFSTTTLFARGLEASKERLLNPVTGGTVIDIDTVEKMFAGVEGALFPFISDGEISNWDSVKDRFIAIAKRQQTFMVQVGPHTPTSRDLLAAGIKVLRTNTFENAVQPVIDFGSKVYGAAKEEKMEREKGKYRNLRGR